MFVEQPQFVDDTIFLAYIRTYLIHKQHKSFMPGKETQKVHTTNVLHRKLLYRKSYLEIQKRGIAYLFFLDIFHTERT